MTITSPAEAKSIAFVDVNALPMHRPGIDEHQTILIENDRIIAIGPASEIPIPAHALRIEGYGRRFLIPGLIDMHVHFNGSWDAPLYLAAGVTTVRNMAGRVELLDWRGNSRTGPRLYTAGPILDGCDSLAMHASIVETPEDAQSEVLRQAKAGYDFVKVYDALTYEAYCAIVEASRGAGLRVTGHVPRLVRLRRALRHHQDSIEHLSGYADPIESANSPLRGRWHWRKEYLAIEADEERMQRVAEATAHAGTWNCPTLAVTRGLFQEPFEGANQGASHSSRPQWEAMVPEEVRRNWHEHWLGGRARNLEWMNHEALEMGARVRGAMALALNKAGAGLLAGSDAPNHGMLPGYSLIEELVELTKAGLSEWEALQAATYRAAAFLGVEDRLGSIAVGRGGDVVLLEANPLENIGNLRSKAGVMSRGKWYE